MLHQTRDRQGRVGGEGRGDHGRPGQPPGHVPAGDEEVADASRRPLPEVNPDPEADGEIGGDDGDVDRRQTHSGLISEPLGRCQNGLEKLA
jgi:hypothetical protein